MKTTILWDNDGVLVDTERLFYQATREILSSKGVALSREEFIELSLSQGKSMFDKGIGECYAEAEIPQLREKRDARYAAILKEQSSEIPGVRRILEFFQGKVKMGVVTSSHREHFDIIHSHTSFIPFFDFVVANGDYEREKPYPDAYKLGLDKAKCKAENAVAVEDSFRGYNSAKAAGVDVIVVRTEFNQDIEFPDALAVVKNPEELFEKLKEVCQ